MKLGWRRVNLLFVSTQSVQFATEGHLIAFTPLLLQEVGLRDAEVAVWSGLLFAVMTGVALPLAPFWGVLAERFSRRSIILRSYYLLAAALLVSAWAPDLWAMVVARMLIGLSFGTMGVIIGTQALLTPRRKLGTAIATLQIAMPIAASLGPPLGSLLIPLTGLRGLFVVDAVATLVAGLVLTVLLPEPVSQRGEGSVLGRTGQVLGQVWTILPIRWNFASAFMLRGASSVVEGFLPVRITQVADDPATAIGWILGLYGALSTVASVILTRVIERTDELKLYTRTMLFATLVTAGLALAPWLWLVGLLAVLRAVPVAFGNALLHTHAARVLPPEQATPIFSLAPMPRNAGSLLLPLLAAAVAATGPGAALAVSSVGYLGTYAASLRLAQVTRRTRPP